MGDQVSQSPRVYLDQNFLSEIAKGTFPLLFESFRSRKMQLIYSWMHIKETARCREKQFHLQIANALTEMNGAYLHQNTLYFDRSPQQQLDEYLSTQSDVSNQTVASMGKFLHKFFGGQKGKDFRQLVDDQRKAHADLMAHMVKCIEMLDEEERGLIDQYLPILKMLPETYTQQFEDSAEKMLQRFETDFPSSTNFNAATEFRSANKIDHVLLDKIQPPQVMEQIWGQINSTGKTFAPFEGANEFLAGMSKATGEEFSMETKIITIYNFLCLIGYQADEKLGRDNKFRAALSDHTHAACGAYSQVFITADERMAMKVFAIYEYLKIQTHVCLYREDKKTGKSHLLVGKEIFAST
ncbi:MAG: hypothetical protein ABI536_07330 [Gallionella sp.]